MLLIAMAFFSASLLLQPDRILRWSAALLFIQIVVGLIVAIHAYGPVSTLVRPTNIDFNSFYTAGLLANAGTPQLAYDKVAHFAAQVRLVGVGYEDPQYQFFYTRLSS